MFQLYYEGKSKEARSLLNQGSEPNETRLGLSTGKPEGRGASQQMLEDIFKGIEKEGLLDEGLIIDYKDLTIFVEDFGEDRMSDLITNIIRSQLSIYTVEQSIKYKLPLTEQVQEIGMAWNKDKLKWEMINDYALLADGALLLLVPKKIVVKKYLHSIDYYLNKTVLEWRQKYHKDNNTHLAQRIPLKESPGVWIKEPAKKDVREEEIRKRKLSEKEYAIEQSRKNSSLIGEFHSRSELGFDTSWSNRLTDDDLEEIIEKVKAIQKNI